MAPRSCLRALGVLIALGGGLARAHDDGRYANSPPKGDSVRAFQTRRSGCSFIDELPTGAAETPSFQRQRSCHRQASQSLINRRFFLALSALTPGCARALDAGNRGRGGGWLSIQQ